MNLLDFISNLTTADSRAGQNRAVKALVKTIGYVKINEGLSTGADTQTFEANATLGVIQDTATIVFKNAAGQNKRLAYTKITLDEPITDTKGNVVAYLWFPTKDIVFADNTTNPVAPVSAENTALVPVYSESPSGITLRDTPSTLGKKVRLVSYGDIVGYTDNTTKLYLTFTFWKIYDQKGKAIGWCAKGKGYSSTTKPQAKALPKLDANGETDQNFAGITPAQDPQAGNTTGISWGKVATYGAIVLIGGYFIIKGIASLFPKKANNGND